MPAWPLLMTATIAPVAVPRMPLHNPAARWAQYAAALQFWLARPGLSGVVFCDNSGYGAPYGPFHEVAVRYGIPLEVLSWADNQAGMERGKGFGEGRLMERALTESHILRSAPGFYKVTGRLTVTNFDRIERRARCHPRAFCRRFLGQAGWADTRFFKVDRGCFERYLLRAYQAVTEVPEAVGERWALGQAYARALAPLHPPALLPLPDVAGCSSLGPQYGDPVPKRTIKHALAWAGQYRL